MAAPACGVLASAIAAHLRPIKNALDTPSHSPRRLRLRGPDRFEDLKHKAGIDRLHRQRAYRWIGIGGERRIPLCGMLGVAPTGSVRRDVAFSTLPEGDSRSRFKTLS